MNTPCQFQTAQSQFRGTPLEQARCLLRRVKVVGNVDDAPAQLPEMLANIVGKPVAFTRDQLSAYLAFKGISPADVGGPLTGDVSINSQGKKALYFVIHDTSD